MNDISPLQSPLRVLVPVLERQGCTGDCSFAEEDFDMRSGEIDYHDDPEN